MSLHYIIRSPKTKQDLHPLVLLLHGYGSNEQDLFSFANELPAEAYVISVRAPYHLSFEANAFAWYAINFGADNSKFSDVKQAKESLLVLKNLIDELLIKFPIDANDVTLMGFSQGAILSYALGLSYPEKIRRIVAMSGYFNPEMVLETQTDKVYDSLQIFASHGLVDEVIPISWAEQSLELLKPFHIPLSFHSYPVGHGVAPQNFADILNWLTATKRQS
ncbi:MAG: alpha/beta hydrolase [Flavobacterium sp.]